MGHDLVAIIGERLEVPCQQHVPGGWQALARPTNRVRELGGDFLTKLRAVVYPCTLALRLNQHTLLRVPNTCGRDVAVIPAEIRTMVSTSPVTPPTSAAHAPPATTSSAAAPNGRMRERNDTACTVQARCGYAEGTSRPALRTRFCARGGPARGPAGPARVRRWAQSRAGPRVPLQSRWPCLCAERPSVAGPRRPRQLVGAVGVHAGRELGVEQEPADGRTPRSTAARPSRRPDCRCRWSGRCPATAPRGPRAGPRRPPAWRRRSTGSASP